MNTDKRVAYAIKLKGEGMGEFKIDGFYVFMYSEFNGELEQYTVKLDTYDEAKRFADRLKNSRVEIFARLSDAQ